MQLITISNLFPLEVAQNANVTNFVYNRKVFFFMIRVAIFSLTSKRVKHFCLHDILANPGFHKRLHICKYVPLRAQKTE